MNPLERQISDAAPWVQPATFPIHAGERIPPDDAEALGPGLPPSRSTARVRQGDLGRKLLVTIAALALLVAGGVGFSAALQPASELHDSNLDGGRPVEGGAAVASTPPGFPAEWRTATLLSPWADASISVEATVELPAAWSVRRHEPSAEFPGLHVTVVDEDSLPVATLYFGPSADQDSCPLRAETFVPLQRADVTTGAQLLDPALASAFSYGLTTEPEPRGSFGLVPQTSNANPCGDSVRDPGTPLLILRFGDLLGLGPAATAPRSSYARTFATVEDARHYVQSQEFATLKRLITSLKFSFPEDRSQLWQLPDNRRPSN